MPDQPTQSLIQALAGNLPRWPAPTLEKSPLHPDYDTQPRVIASDRPTQAVQLLSPGMFLSMMRHLSRKGMDAIPQQDAGNFLLD